jgi:uncharacterized protein YbjQ (UPF0145 family)
MNWITTKLEEFDITMSKLPEWLVDVAGGSTFWDIVVSNGLQVGVIGIIGWLVATWFERQHLKSMDEREVKLEDITINNLKKSPDYIEGDTQLLIGSIVISHDYFRTLVIIIKKLIGGNIKAYERLTLRGRREAIIRLKEDARRQGFNKIINIRFGGTQVAPKFITAVEIVAYGTGTRVS